MKYFAIAILLVVYFEILGQYLQSKFNKHLCEIGLGIGLIVFLAYAYITTSILSAKNFNFIIVIIIYSLFFVVSTFFIIKDIKRIKYKFTYLHLLWVVLIGIFVYYSLNQSLGHLHGFDSTFYLNLVSGNANVQNMNSFSVLYGNNGTGHISYQYTFQSFYYFASYISFIASRLFGLYPGTTYIWSFQILFYGFFFSLLLNTYKKIANKHYLILAVAVILLGFYFCKLYFNSVLGFFGNNYRIVCVGYMCYMLKEYFDNSSYINKTVLSIAALAACSVSSSSLFIVFIMFFAVFVINCESDRNMLKWVSISLYIPLINLLTVVSLNIRQSGIYSTIIMLIVFILGDFIISKIKKCKPGIIIIIVSMLLMIIMSYKITGNLLDFSAFTNNIGNSADMTVSYFNMENAPIIQNIYTLVFIISFIGLIVVDRKNKMLLMCLVVFLVFLNPFCCTYYFKINQVYHRTWDIIINPFIYIYVITMVFAKINNKTIEKTILLIISIISFLNIKMFVPSYYNDSFIINDHYNKLYKMDNEEIDIVNKLKEDINNNDIEVPKIVTQNVLTQSMIPNAIYTYGRESTSNMDWSEADYQVYAIFFEERGYDGRYQPKDADTENVEKYIKEAGIDYLVLDKEWSYKDSKAGEWQPLMYKIDEFQYPFYENEKYVIYHFNK